MDVNDLKSVYAEIKLRMDGAIEHARKELAGLRSGRASVNLLDPVHVDAYGSLDAAESGGLPVRAGTDLDPRDAVRSFLLSAIERGIQKSNLGLNPSSDGKVVRIPIPSLTEERRKEMSRLVHKYAEEARNSVRQVRRDANERLKKLLKDHLISEDDERRALDDVQKITDQHVAMIDEFQKKKDTELLGK